MKGLFINCPYKACKKLMIKNAYLRPGSFLTIKCYNCGGSVEIDVDQGIINLRKTLDKDLQDDLEDDTVFMSV